MAIYMQIEVAYFLDGYNVVFLEAYSHSLRKLMQQPHFFWRLCCWNCETMWYTHVYNHSISLWGYFDL